MSAESQKRRSQMDFGAKCYQHGFQKVLCTYCHCSWIQTHLKMQFSVHILLQSPILPNNLTSKNFHADRKVTFFVISPVVNLFLWATHKIELPYEMKTLLTIICKINFHNCVDKAG